MVGRPGNNASPECPCSDKLQNAKQLAILKIVEDWIVCNGTFFIRPAY